jgi:hypothetical protein
MTTATEIIIDLGFIGHKAEKFQALFTGYTAEPNENGYFLKFENVTDVCNEGVHVWTNCFEDEDHFNEVLMTKLKFNL